MPVDRATIRERLIRGDGPDTIAQGDREIHRAAIEEQARLDGELGTYDATPDAVSKLREQGHRWEAIAVRVFGQVRDLPSIKLLYDQKHGDGAHRRSYTGRGRRFPGMTDGPDGRRPALPATTSGEDRGEVSGGPLFHVLGERAASQERLAELEALRTGDEATTRSYLEQHLHSDRFYLDANRIWLELPNREDAPADKLLLTWFLPLATYIVAAPTDGSSTGRHAIPTGWTHTLCRLPISEWTSGLKRFANEDVSCRWCSIRLVATELAIGAAPTPIST